MRRDGTRLARRALLLVLVGVAAAVSWSIRRPSPSPGAVDSATAEGPEQGTTLDDMSFLRFREGDRKVEVKAREVVGREGSAMRLRGVEVVVPYVQEGREGTARITSDQGLYRAEPQEATFQGNVRVRTEDGLELETETLEYLAEQKLVKSDDPARFRRGRMSGSGRGVEYRWETGRLDVRSEVKLRLESEGEPPTFVEAGSLWGLRRERRLMFEGGTSVEQGPRRLRSERLQVFFTEDLARIDRLAAIEDVDLRVGPGAELPGVVTADEGEKRLSCRKLQVFYRDGVPLEARAVNPAALEVAPGPGGPRERRRVEAQRIHFHFDEEGRLRSVEGHGGGPKLWRSTLTAVPVGGEAGEGRRVESGSFVATLEPATGAVQRTQFSGNVVFSEPGRKAWANRATYDEAKGVVTLTGDPRIEDEKEGSELRGRRIVLGARDGSVSARESVRHRLSGEATKGERTGMLSGSEPVLVLCREFDYDPAARAAHYGGGALMRSGRDEIRAPTLVLQELPDGLRRLTASGGTSSLLHPRPAKGAEKEPAPVEARSREMVYEEKARRIVYTGEVEIRQGDIVTRSPEAVVTLAADGRTVDRMLAGEPVEVVQGRRRATGQRGTYTPADETLVLVGDEVVLQDVDRRLLGRTLVFEVGSERIRVDGRDEVRTEAVFKRPETPNP